VKAPGCSPVAWRERFPTRQRKLAAREAEVRGYPLQDLLTLVARALVAAEG
jgi:hypothetical protein